MRRIVPLIIGLGLAASACADSPTVPHSAARVHAAMAAADRTSVTAGGYLVAFRGGGVPAGFASDVATLGGRVLWSHGGVGLASVAGLDAAGAATLGRSRDVAEVDPDPIVSLEAPPASRMVRASLPGVTAAENPAGALLYGWQWNMLAIHADAAWSSGHLGSAAVTVAILDTGVDYDDYDLAGLVDLSRSKSFVESDDEITATYFPTRSAVSDYNGHGTNVASQVSSNALVYAGVTSRTTLMAVKVLGADGQGGLGAILGGVLWAADHGANIANMSLGGAFAKAAAGRLTSLVNGVFNYARRRGMLIVVSAGNDSEDMDHDGNLNVIFCASPHVLCVSALGPTLPDGSPDEFAGYSNYGRSEISVAAPGGNIGSEVALWPWGAGSASAVWSLCSKTYLSGGDPTALPCANGLGLLGYAGTSQAAPHVSGLAALLAAGGITDPAQLKAIIQKSAVDLGQPGVDPFYGAGRIDVARALELLR